MKTIHDVLRDHPGFLHIAIGQAGAVALGAVFWFVMARLLKPGAYGNVNWLMSIAMFASTFCVLGWGKTVVTYSRKIVAKNDRKAVTIVPVAKFTRIEGSD